MDRRSKLLFGADYRSIINLKGCRKDRLFLGSIPRYDVLLRSTGVVTMQALSLFELSTVAKLVLATCDDSSLRGILSDAIQDYSCNCEAESFALILQGKSKLTLGLALDLLCKFGNNKERKFFSKVRRQFLRPPFRIKKLTRVRQCSGMRFDVIKSMFSQIE